MAAAHHVHFQALTTMVAQHTLQQQNQQKALLEALTKLFNRNEAAVKQEQAATPLAIPAVVPIAKPVDVVAQVAVTPTVPTALPFTTPATPATVDGENLMRSDSLESMGSCQSLGSEDSSKKRRRPSNPTKKMIKREINDDVMQALDDKLLAPQRSIMFKRFPKKIANQDGTYTLKQNFDIDMKVFRVHIKPILAKILGDKVNDRVLSRNYFRVALELAKKRRANHVQSWRLYNKPKPLIYNCKKTCSRQRQQGP